MPVKTKFTWEKFFFKILRENFSFFAFQDEGLRQSESSSLRRTPASPVRNVPETPVVTRRYFLQSESKFSAGEGGGGREGARPTSSPDHRFLLEV